MIQEGSENLISTEDALTQLMSVKDRLSGVKDKMLGAVNTASVNIGWGGKIEQEEPNDSQTLDNAMKKINHFFDSNQGVFDEMKLYRRYSKYDLDIEKFRQQFKNTQMSMKEDILELSNVLNDVGELARETIDTTNVCTDALGLRADKKNAGQLDLNYDIDTWDTCI